MALTDREKQMVIDYLDSLDDALVAVILASLEAFSEWLAENLYSIYQKIKQGLSKLWRWLCSMF